MNQPVLIIYSGGTIGMVPRDAGVSGSPLVPGRWEQLIGWVPQLDRLGVPIRAVSIAQPVDSANMSAERWVEIAGLVRQHYDDCCGVVLLHGTDTMSYTATALAFMLQGLGKPIVVTGAQLPIFAPRTDAIQNFVTAITIAAGPQFDLPVVPEVCLFFGDKLLRGCRTTKVSASSHNAFASPNYPELGTAGAHIEIHAERLRPPGERLVVRDGLSPGVIATRLFPGIGAEVLRAVVMRPEVCGIVLQTYGAGNAPQDAELLDVLGDAVSGGKHVVNVTQCLGGRVVQGHYEASVGLLERGVLSGADMTTEAAIIKLQWLLGTHGHDAAAVRSLMQQDLVGEVSPA